MKVNLKSNRVQARDAKAGNIYMYDGRAYLVFNPCQDHMSVNNKSSVCMIQISHANHDNAQPVLPYSCHVNPDSVLEYVGEASITVC